MESRCSSFEISEETTSIEEPKSSATCFPTLSKSTSWLHGLLSTQFFRECPHHCGQLKAEEHFFCLSCCAEGLGVMCQYCLPLHSTLRCQGPCFQVYRYMYHDVVRVVDIAPLVDVSGIQQYQANGHPAVHLRPKSTFGQKKAKSPVSFTGRCGGCKRSLTPQWKYCSILCSKVGSMEAKYPEYTEATSFQQPPNSISQSPPPYVMHWKTKLGCRKRKCFEPQRSDFQ